MSRRSNRGGKPSAAETIRAIARMDALLNNVAPQDCDPVAVVMRRHARLKDGSTALLVCNIDGEENDDYEHGATRVKYVFDSPEKALTAGRELQQAGLFVRMTSANVYLCDRRWSGRPPHFHLTSHPRKREP